MKFDPGSIYHVYNQGNNRNTIFHRREDYLTFLGIIRKTILPFSEIIAYALMPNHFHFMIYTDDRCTKFSKLGHLTIDPITNGIRKLLSGYARIFNARYNQTGSVLRQKTKAKNLSAIECTPFMIPSNRDYYFNCFNYIHQNPLRAEFVPKMEDWEYSSFKDYAGLRNGTICNKKLAADYCSFQPDSFLRNSYKVVPPELICQLF